MRIIIDKEPKHLRLKLNSSKRHVRIKINHPTGYYDPYSKNEEDYSVVSIPHVDQVFETKEKVMLYDLTVRKIPYYSVTNPSEGLTVYIGQESVVNG